jgi:toxin ParE1/3/4
VEILKRFPKAGRLRPDIAADARVLVESPYLILYRVISNAAQIVRILHGARDIDAALFKKGIE